jgi:hypothetical protein
MTESDVKRVDEDTPQNANPGAAVDSQGVGANPTDSTDAEQNDDPKSGGSPVGAAPTSGGGAGAGDDK